VPAEGYTWNLEEWVRRLFKRPDAPPFNYTIQPVQIVGDASAVSSPILPAFAAFGGFRSAVVARHSALAIRTSAPGGTFVRFLMLSGGGNDFNQWTVSTTPAVIDNVVPMTVLNLGPTDVSGTFRLGGNAVTLGAGLPQGKGNPFSMEDVIYIPGGSEFLIQAVLQNIDMRFAAMIQDVPVAIPEP